MHSGCVAVFPCVLVTSVLLFHAHGCRSAHPDWALRVHSVSDFFTLLCCCVGRWPVASNTASSSMDYSDYFLLSLHQQWAPTWHPSSVTTNSTEHPLKGVEASSCGAVEAVFWGCLYPTLNCKVVGALHPFVFEACWVACQGGSISPLLLTFGIS